MERTSSKHVRMLVEGAMMIAVATVLSFIKMKTPFWVNGGSITAASMVPLFIFAYRWGGIQGIFVGTVYGLLQFFIEPYAAHPMSVFLDYPLAFGGLGVFGFLARQNKATITKIFIAITAGIGFRFVAHFLSGVIFFASYAPDGMNPVVYSMIYNASYLVPEIIISCVVFKLIQSKVDAIK